MANVKISLSDDKKMVGQNIYSDVDVKSNYLENTLKDKKAIENSITNLLSWKQRERIMNPGMGNTLWKRIFDNFSSFSAMDIENEVRRILSYEPRITIKDVVVEPNIMESEISISFTYTMDDFNSYSNGSSIGEYSITISNS